MMATLHAGALHDICEGPELCIIPVEGHPVVNGHSMGQSIQLTGGTDLVEYQIRGLLSSDID